MKRVGVFSHIDMLEVTAVRRLASLCRRTSVSWCVTGLNFLGNGWLYAIILVGLMGRHGAQGLRPMIAGALSAGAAFLIYYLVKPRVARLRPYHKDESIVVTGRPLDHFSFPSGHCMTFTAVAVPLTHAYPPLAPIAICTWALISWARVASGHHYPSDVIAGTFVGASCGSLVCLCAG